MASFGSDEERFWDNVDLRTLDVSMNRLEALPEEIGDPVAGLPHLTKLVAKHNLLAGLPASLATLASLAVLDVSHNQLHGGVPSLAPLANLVELKLEHNQVVGGCQVGA